MTSQFTKITVTSALLITATANAITISALNGPVGTFSVSSTDLGEDPATTLTLDVGTADFGSAVSKLNNGLIYDISGFGNTNESFTASNGAVATFHFDLTGSPGGYDIGSIVSLAAFPGRSKQVFDVEYSLVGNAAFTPLASVLATLPNNTEGGEVEVTIGNLAISGVDDLRFTFHDSTNGDVVYREIDVFGSPIPEPSSAVLVATGILGIGLRRIRSKATPNR